jgi:glucose-6-phosphate 1-epimerase
MQPNFGAPTHPDHSKLPQHGFARSSQWTFDSTVMDNEAGVSVRFSELEYHLYFIDQSSIYSELDPTDTIKAVYDKPFRSVISFSVYSHSLTSPSI